MNKNLAVILHGLGIWLIPFVLGFLLFPVKQSIPELFDAVMAVSVCASAVLFSLLYLKRFNTESFGAGVSLGINWLIICLVVDAGLFVLVFQWGFWQYLADIGVSYLVVPIITIGMAYAMRINGGER